MDINWNVVSNLAAPIIALFVGAMLNRRFESRPNVVTYYGHVSSFRVTPEEGDPFFVFSHTVVLRNNGKRPATGVRITHATLPPQFNIFPSVPYTRETLPSGDVDLVLPVLVPDEEITISYLYNPPLLAKDINTRVRHNDGFATGIPMLLQRHYPLWLSNVLAALLTLGIISLLYLCWILGSFVLSHYWPQASAK